MSLATQLPLGVLISNLAEDGQIVLQDRPEVGDHFDTLRRRILLRDVSLSGPAEAAAGFATGTQLTGTSCYIVSRSAEALAHGIYIIDLVGKGILEASKPSKVKYTAYATQQSAQNIYDPSESTIYAKVVAHEAQVGCDVSYVTSTPPTDDVATAVTPPNAPDVKSSVWAYLTDPTYHYPNGWVLMACDAEQIPGASVWLVTDRYQYIYPISP